MDVGLCRSPVKMFLSTTTREKELRSTPLPEFVRSAGLDPITRRGTGPIEPHVVFDEFLGRWIVTLTCRNDGVSDSPDPAGKWGAVYLSCLTDGPCLERNPSLKLGYDKKGIYPAACQCQKNRRYSTLDRRWHQSPHLSERSRRANWKFRRHSHSARPPGWIETLDHAAVFEGCNPLCLEHAHGSVTHCRRENLDQKVISGGGYLPEDMSGHKQLRHILLCDFFPD
jgi:hypothetical protein